MVRLFGWILLLLVFVFALPNLAKKAESLEPTPKLAFAVALMFWFAVTYFGQPRMFLYFKF